MKARLILIPAVGGQWSFLDLTGEYCLLEVDAMLSMVKTGVTLYLVDASGKHKWTHIVTGKEHS